MMKNRRLLIQMMGLGALGAIVMPQVGVSAVPALSGFPPLPKPKPPLAERRGGRLPVLMLDAGHGGRDPGAIGVNGTREKSVTLDLVMEMADRLDGSVSVQLTRSDDTFLSLPERVSKARHVEADLFISLHADSAPDAEARGLSVYTLSEHASDSFAQLLATGENIVDQRYGATSTGDEAVTDILYDLAARQTVTASRFAKEAIVSGIGNDLHLLNSPKRSANFAVLRAPDVPSLLIETGFLSNPADEEILADNRQRRKIAALLAQEITTILAHPLFV